MNFSLHSTTGPSSATLPPGAQDLPRLQRPVRRRLSPGKVMAGGLAALLGVGGVVVYSVPGDEQADQGPVHRRQAPTSSRPWSARGRCRSRWSRRGASKAPKNKDAYCQVEGQTTIIMIKPEGTQVKKGEIVCELDSAALKDQLVNQKITTKSAEANYENAKLTREVAEIAVVEYDEGIYKQDLATVEGEIKLAESDLSRSEDRLDWARRMFEKGYVSMAAKISEELTLKKARFALEQAQSKKKVLVEYTKGKTIKELKSEVEKARSDELAKKATWDLEDGKEKKLEKQIAACKIKAPSDGLVVYANDPEPGLRQQPAADRGRGDGARAAEDLQPARHHQDAGQHQGSRVADRQAQAGHEGEDPRRRLRRARLLDGTVTDVAPLPDSANFFSSDIKVYTTKVRIDQPLPGLKPGMTAQVEILVDRKDNVLTVPVLAVLQFNGKDHVTKKVDDRFVQTEVELGVSNEKFVEVIKGLKEGDVVVMSPMSLMTDEEKRKAFGSAAKGAKKDWGEDGSRGRRPRASRASVLRAPARRLSAARARRQGGGDLAKAKAKGKGAGLAKGKGGRGGSAPSSRSSRISVRKNERSSGPPSTEEEKAELSRKPA